MLNRRVYLQNHRTSLCSQIAVFRRQENLSQKTLASILGISPANLCRIESGKVNISLDMFIHILYILNHRLEVVSDLPF